MKTIQLTRDGGRKGHLFIPSSFKPKKERKHANKKSTNPRKKRN